MTRSLTSTARRLQLPAVAAVVALLSLTGCQAGQGAQTSQPYNPGDGRNVNVPEDAAFDEDYLALRNVLVVSDGGAASLNARIVNNTGETEVLTQATINGAPVEVLGGVVEIAPGQKVGIGGGTERAALAADPGVAPGQWTEVSFTFTQAGVTTMQVLVIPSDDEYALLGEDA